MDWLYNHPEIMCLISIALTILYKIAEVLLEKLEIIQKEKPMNNGGRI